MKYAWLLTVPLLLANSGRDYLSAQVSALKGASLTVAMDRFGIPSEHFEAASEQVYVWRRGNMYVDDAELRCEVKATVNAEGVVTRADWHGNLYACDVWGKQMKKASRP